MIEAEQIRAARGLLGWSQTQLAEAAGVSLPTVKRMESKGVGHSAFRTVDAIRTALEAAGIQFIGRNGGGPGVRLRK